MKWQYLAQEAPGKRLQGKDIWEQILSGHMTVYTNRQYAPLNRKRISSPEFPDSETLKI